MEGKAKEAFDAWFEKEYRYFTTVNSENVDNRIIVEWLDSVAIIIEIGIHQRIRDLNMWRGKINNILFDDLEYKVSRQEATEAAIKKAVEIYNNR
ncbi:hypothetical protein [Elizabethkingia ursingii]|uniref:Uncharacterized protein n=1 Tax=Elizabethkingia ursingii TaxID=1756150 RepID=A0AAJ3TP23_9FLAO|nr:hypothetical protein [Elizabethkingia ursingii]AQX09836.1 hypothetical protein BBD34_14865 [Elizabethkingia ursingii]OPB75979.1 hypothetical protein BAY32_04235 [Elizabethkingia ursingii]OPB84646.1 hypothetical protein BB021_14915 [Elizabethkingia ursingii]